MTLSIDLTAEQRYAHFGLHAVMPDRMDHSTSGTFGECFRMGYYQHILGRVPKTENYSFTWGKAFHKMTETWLETRSPNEVAGVIQDYIPELVEDRYGRNRSRMMELFVHWADFTEKNPLKVLRNEQPALIACLDSPCPYSPTGCGLVYGGRLDRIVDWNGIVGPLDVKTSVIDDADPVAEYKPSHQMEGYVWLASHLMGKHCWGVILEKAVCNKSKMFVKRYPIPYAKDLIREWAENEIHLQNRIRETFETSAYKMEDWEQNHFRCYKPFKCAYRDICTSPRDGDFRMKFLRDNTIEARWDFVDPNARDEAVAAASEE